MYILQFVQEWMLCTHVSVITSISLFRWMTKLLVTPSKMLLQIGGVLLGTMLLIAAFILILHIKERVSGLMARLIADCRNSGACLRTFAGNLNEFPRIVFFYFPWE